MHTVAIAEAPSRTAIFDQGNPGFKKNFDEKPFQYNHCFTSSHPLFSLSRIKQLLENPVTRPWAVFDSGEIRVGQLWKDFPPKVLSVDEIFEQIQTCNGWIMMRHVHDDPEYGELLNQCLEEVKELSGRHIDEDKKSQEAIIFLTSPKRVTAYHIDRECNFLMQVSGQKTISIFDRNDRDVVPEQELEKFWAKDNNAGIYKPQFQDRAYEYQMTPGTGVHIPVNSPHWVQNSDNVSVTFSISYQYKDWRRKNVYQANYHLRKLGLNPTPPGRSVVLDNVKRVAMESALRAKRILKKKP